MKAELKKQFIYFLVALLVGIHSWMIWYFELLPTRSTGPVLFVLIAASIFLGVYYLANCVTLLKAINESKQQEDETSF